MSSCPFTRLLIASESFFSEMLSSADVRLNPHKIWGFDAVPGDGDAAGAVRPESLRHVPRPSCPALSERLFTKNPVRFAARTTSASSPSVTWLTAYVIFSRWYPKTRWRSAAPLQEHFLYVREVYLASCPCSGQAGHCALNVAMLEADDHVFSNCRLYPAPDLTDKTQMVLPCSTCRFRWFKRFIFQLIAVVEHHFLKIQTRH